MSARPPAAPLLPRWVAGASIKLIGLGGVGSIVARYLVVFLRALDQDARLVLVDGDAFEAENAERMLFASHGNKAEVVRDELRPAASGSRLTLLAVPEYVTPENLPRLVVPGDIVLLCVDNHATRHIVDEHCRGLSDVCLISGGNDGVGPDSAGRVLAGTFGNCQVHVRHEGRDRSPPLGRYHAEIERPADRAPGDEHCTDAVARTPQILFANLTAAACLLNALWLHLCGALHYGELAFDIRDGVMRPLPWPVDLPGAATKPADDAAA